MNTQDALEYSRIALWSTRGVEAFAALESAVGERDALRASAEQADNKTLMRLAQDLGVAFSAAKIIYDKAWREAQVEIDALKVEVERLTKEVAMLKDFYALMTERANKAEADLERARPLLEAADGADPEWVRIELDELSRIRTEDTPTMRLLRAALAHRQAKEK